MRIGFYGDDFTGSVDAMLQLSRSGLDVVLATSVEAAAALGAGHDVVGIAGIARSLPAEAMAAEVVPALSWLLAHGAQVVQYKACSTADSSPEVGSLGRVVELGRGLLGPAAVPALFAQPDFGRYTFFGHHFAREGERVHRLDRQPTMSRHPVTPATDSDLVRHLAAQTTLPVGSLDWTRYREGDPEALAALIGSATEAAVVLDGFSEQHLDLVGQAIWLLPGPVLAIGAGGLSLGLGRALGGAPWEPPSTMPAAEGPLLVLCGSRSAATWGQVRAAAAAGWAAIDLGRADAVAEAVAAHGAGRDTVVYSSSPGGAELTSQAVVAGLVQIGRSCLAAAPRSRLVVAGGDTSGAVLRGLGAASLRLLGAAWANVVLCAMQAPGEPYDGIELVLKGGQMGHPELFEDIRRGRSATDPSPTNREADAC